MDSGNLSITSRSLDTNQKFICKSIAQYIHSGIDAHHGWTSSAESPLLVIFLDSSSTVSSARVIAGSVCRLNEKTVSLTVNTTFCTYWMFSAFAMVAIVLDCHISNLRNGTQYPCLPMPERRDSAIEGVVPNLVSSNTATIAPCLPLRIVWT